MAYDVNKVIAIAKAEVGYLEKRSNACLDSKTANAGSANYTKYGRDMHNLLPGVMDFPAAWCDAFVDWCFWKAYGVAGAKKILCGNFDDYTVNSAQYYKKAGRWSNTPVVGAQVFFTNGTRICHTGLVIEVTASSIVTIEGNTSGASGVIANGGGVCRKSYPRSYSRIAGYGIPDYGQAAKPVESSSSKSYLSKGDVGVAVKDMQKMLIACGYSCGTAGTDGYFGNGSEKALKKFQKAYGLTVDGLYGSKSKAKLKSVYAEKTSAKPTATKKAVESAQKRLNSIAGTYKVTADWLNVRTGAGKEKANLVTIPKGTEVKCYGYYTAVKGVKWLYIQFAYKGVKYIGFASSTYLKKK